MTDTLPADYRESRFPCPVPWCEGRTWTHGADGAGPDDWMHEGESLPLAGVLSVQRWATAHDPERWVLRSALGEIAEAATPAEIATMLDAASAALRIIASDPTTRG